MAPLLGATVPRVPPSGLFLTQALPLSVSSVLLHVTSLANWHVVVANCKCTPCHISSGTRSPAFDLSYSYLSTTRALRSQRSAFFHSRCVFSVVAGYEPGFWILDNERVIGRGGAIRVGQGPRLTQAIGILFYTGTGYECADCSTSTLH